MASLMRSESIETVKSPPNDFDGVDNVTYSYNPNVSVKLSR